MAREGEQKIPVDVALSILRDVLRQDDADRYCPSCGSEEILPGLSELGQRTCANGHKFETELLNVPMAQVKDLYWTVVKWARDRAFPIQNLVDVELRLRASLRYPDRVHGGSVERELTGRIDALWRESEARYRVDDWKDTWGLPAERRDDDDDDRISENGYFQQRFYAWLIFRCFPQVKEVVLHEEYVRWSESRSAVIGREMESEIEAELAALAERFDRAFEEEVFPATPGKWCNLCTRPTACPIPAFARAEGRITDEERAHAVAGQLEKAKAIVKQTSAAVQAWADTHGPIPVGDPNAERVLGYVKSKRVERPTREQMERAIREAGSLDHLDLSGLYREKWGTRFKAYTPRPEDEGADDLALQRQLEESIRAAAARLEGEAA